MKICPNCSAEIIDTAKFCNKCGFNVKKYEEEKASNNAFCIECGASIPADSVFCPECGFSVGTEQAPKEELGFDTSWLSELEFNQNDGEMSSFIYESHGDGTYTVTGLKDKLALKITVPDGVVAIGDRAFCGSEAISIELPEGLLKIGNASFKGLKELCGINLPSSLVYVGDEAFMDCILLDIELPKSVRKAGRDALKNTISDTKSKKSENSSDWDSISNEELAELFEKEGFVVEDGVLVGYNGKKRNIAIRGVEEIYDNAFYENQTITCVEIKEGIKSIGRRAFASCSSLIEINIPASCKIIYPDIFEDVSLKTLILTRYNKAVVECCLSDVGKEYFNEINVDDFVERKDGKVYVSVEKIEKTASQLKKAFEEEEAERKRQEQMRILEEKRLRQEQERKEKEKIMLANWGVGSVHTMGVYKQSTQAEPKPIEWIVLERNENKVLLISRFIIDRQKFNEESEYISWEKCTLRKWLNNNFYNTAFTVQEKSKILTTPLKNTPNPRHGTSSGNSTNDQIFLLSIDEVKKYFKNDAETRCQVTLYAKERGAYCDGAYFGYWWLRTAGQIAQNASYIFYAGGVSEMGYDVTGTIFGVRPAMWIQI